jgi:DNA-binding transcriptional LysR family regulator
MDIAELRSFAVLASHLHFGRAAQVLHLSQPALTKQIRRLEDALGGRLLERGKHGAKLTVLGARALPQVREVVGAFDRLSEDTRRAAAGRTGLLRIGFGSYTFELAPRLIVKLRAAEPDLEITLRDMSTSEQLAGVQAGQLDVGFTRLPLPAATGQLENLPVLAGHLALVQPAEAARRGPIRLRDCRERPFVILSKERSPGLYDRVLSLCARHGFHPRIVQEVSELSTALALVRSGMGLAIIPDSTWARRFSGVEISPIRESAAAWTVAAVWRRGDTNAALRRFLDLLRSEIRG